MCQSKVTSSLAFIHRLGALFSKAPETFRARKARAKKSNLTLTELCYSHILNMNRGSLHTGSFRHINLSSKVKSDHRSKFSNLSNWKEEA